MYIVMSVLLYYFFWFWLLTKHYFILYLCPLFHLLLLEIIIPHYVLVSFLHLLHIASIAFYLLLACHSAF
jgi:hypothetical protein